MLYTGNFIKTILIVIAQFYWHWYWHMYQYIIIKHVNNSFTVFSSTINIFTRDHTLIKYITVTVINQQFDPLIQSTFHAQCRSNQQNHCIAQNLIVTNQLISGCWRINGEWTQSMPLISLGSQHADIPPSKTTCCPVVMALLSLSKNKTVFTTSSSSKK